MPINLNDVDPAGQLKGTRGYFTLVTERNRRLREQARFKALEQAVEELTRRHGAVVRSGFEIDAPANTR